MNASTENLAAAYPSPDAGVHKRVIFASSLGTMFEWYDFFLAGSLAVQISHSIFSGVNPTAAFIFTLLSFAAGFAVRPFGALVFGRIGDMVGRKYTFLVTISLMGLATFVIGLLPGYASIGLAAPILFVAMRMLQGLALGGEYGGAVVYVAEHSSNETRGAKTAWIQATAALGLLLSLAMILPTRYMLGETSFMAWGWRVPFLVSLILLTISLWIRVKLHESPEFERMKREGTTSKSPISEAFGQWRNLKLVLLGLFGMVMGQAVVWYAGQFYSMFFLTQTLKVDGGTANLLIIVATIITTPFYVIFGKLSDRIGRKPVFLSGCLLAAIFFFPLFKGLTHFANPALEAAHQKAPITVRADPGECSFQFNPAGTSKFVSSCDIARSAITKAGLNYTDEPSPKGELAQIRIGERVITSFDGKASNAAVLSKTFDADIAKALHDAGYETGPADPARINKPMAILLIVLLMLFGTMTYGPIAAMLVELFPSRIRYTAMSLPYHVGIGWFGGFLPAASFAISAASGDIYAGLWYPVSLAAVCFVVCLLFVKESKGADIYTSRTNQQKKA
ncbi:MULTISPECIES: MFS transporter [unclassified Burkholderia]|uniref:MFS transporter n=1 Tax=unclassified Burkholderia TaxID=2613784 RepID=UPI000F55B9A1|nr:MULTISPECIES: MFS transporter [unclassified Burkholderia]RQS26895.1 MFS transporter [Burkholderia sp. Bp8995]RQS51796.1 MFS transporter [Burkholderia sp. Bp8989]